MNSALRSAVHDCSSGLLSGEDEKADDDERGDSAWRLMLPICSEYELALCCLDVVDFNTENDQAE